MKGFSSFTLLVLVGLVTLLAPLTTNAQARTFSEDDRTRANETRQYATNSVNGLSNEGLLRCSDPNRTTVQSVSNGSRSYSCNGAESTAGELSDYRGIVSWGANDTIKCSYFGGTQSGGTASSRAACVINRTGGTTTYFYDFGIIEGRAGYRIATFRGEELIDFTAQTGAEQIGGQVAQGVVDMGEQALKGVAWLILQFSTMLLGWAGSLFNWVIVKGVFQFSLLVGNSPGLLAAWSILRDLGNILLLFGFIFIGISTILGTGKFGDKKALPKLLIFAVLMNFSLFAAEAVIDSANLLASTMYNQASVTSCVGETTTTAGSGDRTREDCALNYGISGHIIQSSGLATSFAAENQNIDTAVMIGLAAFVTIGAVVLFSASFMLITRAIVLTFLMITSPIGFAGMALPPMQKFAKQWWSKLLHQAFYAPVLLLMIFISLKITDSFTGQNVGDRNLAAALTNPEASVMGVLLVFALVIGFMIASIAAAKKFGIAGADFAMNMVNKTARLPLGAGNAVARAGVGGAASRFQKSYNSTMANSNKFTKGLMRYSGLDRTINSTLDAGKNKKFGGRSYADSKKENEARDKELAEIKRKEQKGESVDKAMRDAERARRDRENAATGSDEEKRATEKEQDANDKLAEVLESLTAKEIEELGVLKKSGKELEKIAESLSPEKFAALMKDGNTLSEGKKEELRKARFQKVNGAVKENEQKIKKAQSILNDDNASDTAKDDARANLNDATKAIREVTKEYSAKDLQNMSSSDLSNDALLMSLTNTQRDELLKSNNVSPATARKIKRYDPVEQVKAKGTAGNGAAAAELMRKMKLNTTQVARLGIDVLITPEVAKALKVSEIRAIEKREEFGTDERAKLKQAIEDAGNLAVRTYMTGTERGRENWT